MHPENRACCRLCGILLGLLVPLYGGFGWRECLFWRRLFWYDVNMKRLIGPLVVAVITVLFASVLIVNKPQPEVGEAAVNRIGVYVERATRTVRAEVTVYGEVRPRVQIDVISEVSGRVTSVSPRFIEGGSIGAGDALLTIEDRDYVLACLRHELA